MVIAERTNVRSSILPINARPVGETGAVAEKIYEILLDNVSKIWYIYLVDEKSCIIYSGPKFSIEWYYDKDGESVAYDYFVESTDKLQDKFLILIKRMGDFGKILDKTKFRNEGDGIYAFKPQPDRYLSFFTDDKKIIVTNGFVKKTDKLPKNEKKLAIKYRQDYFERKTGGKK